MEVTELVPHPARQNLVQAIWKNIANELRDLQQDGAHQWAQEAIQHLHTAIHRLMEGLWLRSLDLTNTNTNMEMEMDGGEWGSLVN